MHFKIHRGTKEIGGSCVEVWTENTRILLDFGMPLVTENGDEFSFSLYKELTWQELVDKGILHDIRGLYPDADKLIDGVVISHAHQDHFGLLGYINPNVKHYLGEATHKIIELNNIFTQQEIHFENTSYFEKSKSLKIDDITITPYLADHSSFDAYSFLVEANGKSIFYSGDFRNHGRKANAFKWFTHNAPQNVDYLLLEGTTIGRTDKHFKTETEIENELVEVFKQPDKINLIYSSGQNIDRLVSIYRACIRSNKTMVVDVYVASVLKTLSQFAGIPFPSKNFKNLKVMFPYYTSRRLNKEGHKQILYQFTNYKIVKEEISKHANNIVMTVRPSMLLDLKRIPNIDGGNMIYSMWDGYKNKSTTSELLDWLESKNFTVIDIHTSGHADTPTLKRMVEAIQPKYIVPIHTFKGDYYQDIFDYPIVRLKDGEIREV